MSYPKRHDGILKNEPFADGEFFIDHNADGTFLVGHHAVEEANTEGATKEEALQNFIVRQQRALESNLDVTYKLVEFKQIVKKARAVLADPENENALKKSIAICEGRENFNDMTDGLEMAALIYFLANALEAQNA